MTSTVMVQKDELVDRLAGRVAERLPGAEGRAAERFLRLYYTHIAPQDLLERDEDALLGAALALWRFAADRRPGEIRVRVYNPSPETEGYRSEHTVVETVQDDIPFLVDSITGELNRRGRAVHLVVHPQVPVTRDAEGHRLDIQPEEAGVRESWIHVEIGHETSQEALGALETALGRVLADVRTVVEDWRPMKRAQKEILQRLEEASPGAAAEDLEETRSFLRWLVDNHFTFLGFREYDVAGEEGHREVVVHPGSGLGLLRETTAESFPLSPETVQPVGPNRLLVVSKAGRRSSVHRPVHMDYVGVRWLDAEGREIGGASFVGLFTSGVYSNSAAAVPYLAGKIGRVMGRAGFLPASHDAKALLHILETFPRDELFQMTDEELLETGLGILQLQGRQRLALFVRKDPAERFVSCLVYVPRDRYHTDLRNAMQEILAAAFQGSISAFYTQLADAPLAQAHFIVRTTPGRIPPYDPRQIEAKLTEASLSWTDHLERELVAAHGEGEALALLRRYREAFPASYQEDFDARAAVRDLEEIEALLAGGDLRLDLYRPPGLAAREVRFKIFHMGPLRSLSDVLPMLENMGLKVVTEVPYEIRPAELGETVWIRTLALVTALGTAVDPLTFRHQFQEAFRRIWTGELESDAFNRLVLAAGLEWRQVVVLRAYARYLKQVGIVSSQSYMAGTLSRYPEVSRLLVELFEARLDPEQAPGNGEDLARTDPASPAERSAREVRCRRISAQIRTALNGVARLDEDRILRRFRNVIEATLRTNHFQRGPRGGSKPYLSVKLDSRRVRGLPPPRPMVEIFVYSPRTEAVHLRGGPVARGGIRWSDRQEDFRTEILGLMKAQMVKNAVIVPVGAKGGFIVKRQPTGSAEEQLAEGIECYRTLVRGLLDLTDNRRGEAVVPPPRVVRWDGDDPYLVVAADKGTATFSDIANAVAEEYEFWLGDAFASGGSVGYDHKKMGITARGAWESVKRHFREMGRDIQAEPFTVVGVGDMSGDVFGNAMLLSREIRLIGAFNHRHVFIDPSPDPAASYEERQRLFRLPRSTWEDYDRGALSAGGGIFDRSAKSVHLSPEIRERLGVEKESLTPSDLIRALLRAEVDLLFFGGIGTFVKASEESHAATGDRQNDDLRVDARELRCRVIGEGANLGLTQRGRIEVALGGGRLNTDFIDNSGGVDCSDHEVNFKILLRDAVSHGRLSPEARNELLRAMTDEVSELVLKDNYLQTQAISITEAQGAAALGEQEMLMRDLEREGKLDRALEGLPDEVALAERPDTQRRLTRPEIAVLLAYAKIRLYQELLDSDLPEDPLLLKDLFLYFPPRLRERFQAEVERHRLRREIIATHVTNSMVNRVGPTFVTRLQAETGGSATEIARAYTFSRDIFGLRELWRDLEALDNRVAAQLQIAMMQEASRLVEHNTLWFLRKGSRALRSVDWVARFEPAVRRLAEALGSLLAPEDEETLGRLEASYREQGIPEGLDRRLASLRFLDSACEITEIAHHHGVDVEAVGRVYFRVGARFQLGWLRQLALEETPDGSWSKAAAATLVEGLFNHQGALVRGVLSESQVDGDPLEAWLGQRAGAAARLDQLVASLRTAAAPELAALVVIEHHLRLLAAS